MLFTGKALIKIIQFSFLRTVPGEDNEILPEVDMGGEISFVSHWAGLLHLG